MYFLVSYVPQVTPTLLPPLFPTYNVATALCSASCWSPQKDSDSDTYTVVFHTHRQVTVVANWLVNTTQRRDVIQLSRSRYFILRYWVPVMSSCWQCPMKMESSRNDKTTWSPGLHIFLWPRFQLAGRTFIQKVPVSTWGDVCKH